MIAFCSTLLNPRKEEEKFGKQMVYAVLSSACGAFALIFTILYGGLYIWKINKKFLILSITNLKFNKGFLIISLCVSKLHHGLNARIGSQVIIHVVLELHLAFFDLHEPKVDSSTLKRKPLEVPPQHLELSPVQLLVPSILYSQNRLFLPFFL